MKIIEKINRKNNVKYELRIYRTDGRQSVRARCIKALGEDAVVSGNAIKITYYTWNDAVEAARKLVRGNEYYEIEKKVRDRWTWGTGIMKGGVNGKKPRKREFVGYKRKHVIFFSLLFLCVSVSAQQRSAEKDYRPVAILAHAFAMVESGDNVYAENGNCIGWLQISPIMVKEANRIIGWPCFNNEDRYDKQGSLAIFVIVMREKNPDMSVRKACEIWNPRAGKDYYERVSNCYDMILSEELELLNR